MNGRMLLKWPLVFALAFGLVFGGGAEAEAQSTPTDKVAACVDNAADKFVECTDMGGFANDLACGIKYAADAILCVPSQVLKPF